MKKIIFIIIVAIIVAVGIVAFFIFQNPFLYERKSPIENIGKCGDNICNDFEKANPNACPTDCLSAQSSQPPQTSSKSQSSLSVSSSSSEKKSASSKSSYYSSASSEKVKIINPTKGQVFHAGDTVNVEVSVSNKKAMVLIVTSTRESTMIEKPPYNFKFIIPNEAIGSLDIMVVARDVAEYIGSDKVAINVSVKSNLIDIKVYPEEGPLPVYLSVGSAQPLNVYGIYGDKVQREITSGSGTSYTSSNPAIAEVSAEGLITAKSKGEAIITIEYGGIKKKITILGVSEPDMRVSPAHDPYNFGIVSAVGHSEIKKFTIKNMGIADLVIGTLSITSGADPSMFIIQNDGCSRRTVKPSEECTIDIVFTPASEGAKSAYFSIPSNDPSTKNLIMRLTGTL